MNKVITCIQLRFYGDREKGLYNDGRISYMINGEHYDLDINVQEVGKKIRRFIRKCHDYYHNRGPSRSTYEPRYDIEGEEADKFIELMKECEELNKT